MPMGFRFEFQRAWNPRRMARALCWRAGNLVNAHDQAANVPAPAQSIIMCGIAGIMMNDGRGPDPAILDRLQAAIAHRGPDGSGRHLAGSVGLVSTRLAIIDLRTGDQPLSEPAGAVLVANGEIYNDPELRSQL